MLRHGTWLSSRVVKVVAGLLSCSDGESGLSQEDQQGSQASHHVVRGSSVSHWSRCRGIRTYLKLRGNSVPFLLAAGASGFHSRFNRWHRPPLVVRREVGIPFDLKPGMGPYLQMRWETWGSSRVVSRNSGYLLRCDGDLWAPLSCMTGVKPPLEFGEGTWDCSLGAAGTKGLMS